MGQTTQAQLTEEAAGWLVGLDGGTADREAFELWRAGDPRRAVAFAEVAHAWREMDNLRPLRSSVASPPARAIARRDVIRFASAAAAVGVIGLAGFPILNEASATTGAGERRSILLPDGTRAELNTHTKIRWPRLFRERALWLDEGEIALQVAPAATPFRLIGSQPVEFGSGMFSLRREADIVTLLPLSGRAVVGGQTVEVGRIASIANGPPVIALADVAVRQRAADWRRGDLVFEGEMLDAAVAEYNRYLDRPIVLADPGLAHERVGGRFRSADPTPFLRALASGFDARIIDSGSGPIIVSRQQKSTPAL